MDTTRQAPFERIAFIGNYLPRQCGIATFTTDLCEAVATEYPETTCFALPVNDTDAGYAYPPRVRFELAEKDTACCGLPRQPGRASAMGRRPLRSSSA